MAFACVGVLLAACQPFAPAGDSPPQAQTSSATGGDNSEVPPAEVVGGVYKLTGGEQGKKIYTENCAACHGHDGQGVEGVFPALRNNATVVGPYGPVVILPMYGRGAMPSFSGILTDEDIALVLTYIRGAWGNDGDAISPSQVAPFRQEGIEAGLGW